MSRMTDGEALSALAYADGALFALSGKMDAGLQLAYPHFKALIAERDALRQWRFECCEALGLSCAAGAEWTVDDVFRCVQHEESKVIADRDRLTAEVLRLQDAVMESDARGAVLMAENGRLKSIRASADSRHSHQCRSCYLHYTPHGDECEDCPSCGCDGTPESIASRAAPSPATSTGSEVGK